jgi:uncharacterized membrane protein
MIRALKVALVVFGVVMILMGLLLVIFPDKVASMSEVTGYLRYAIVSLGACLLAAGGFPIAAARDPLRHINWVRFAIVWCILGAAVELYSVGRSDITFGHAAALIIMHVFFAVVFLALYPWRHKISN